MAFKSSSLFARFGTFFTITLSLVSLEDLLDKNIPPTIIKRNKELITIRVILCL